MNNQQMQPFTNSAPKNHRPLPEIYLELGQALILEQEYNQAKDALQQALQNNPSPAIALDIRLRLAQVLENLHMPQLALHVYLDGVIEIPDHACELIFLANELLTRSLVITEREWLRQKWTNEVEKITLTPECRSAVECFLGRVGTYLKDYDWAQERFEKAIKETANNTKALEGLGKTLLHNNQPQRAIEVLRRAHQLAESGCYSERLASIEAKLAQALVNAGFYQEALKQIEKSFTRSNSNRYKLSLAKSECYLLMGKPQKALEFAKETAKINPNAAEPDITRARAYIAGNNYSSAILAVNQAQQKEPLNTEALFYEIQAMIENPKVPVEQVEFLLKRYVKRVGYKQIIKHLKSPALTVRDNDWHVHYFIARLYHMLLESWPPESKELEQGGIDISVDELAEILQQALQAVNRAIELQPESNDDFDYPEASLQRLKALLLKDSGSSEAAADFFYEAGRRYGWENKYDMAIELLNSAKELKPYYTPIYWELSDVLRMLSFQEEDDNERQKILAKSLDIWNAGIKIALPEGSASSWAYISRALLNEQLAEWVTLPKSQLWWESIVYLERAITHYQDDAYRWAYLGCYYNRLGQPANALHVTKIALHKEPKNFAALEERILSLIKVGKFNTAKELIEKLKNLTQNTDERISKIEWANKTLACVLIYLGQLSQAQTLLGQLIEASPEDFWCRNLRALCYCMLGDKQKSLEDYLSVYDNYQHLGIANLDVKDQIIYSWAAYYLNKVDETVSILERLRETGEEDCGQILQKLGLCYLQQGDCQLGDTVLKDGISQAKSIPELEDLLNVEFPYLETIVANTHYASQVQEILSQARKHIKLRKSKLSKPISPIKELKQVLQKLEDGDEKDSWEWTGANAGLARLYLESGQLSEAYKCYDAIVLQNTERFPEATIRQAS